MKFNVKVSYEIEVEVEAENQDEAENIACREFFGEYAANAKLKEIEVTLN